MVSWPFRALGFSGWPEVYLTLTLTASARARGIEDVGKFRVGFVLDNTRDGGAKKGSLLKFRGVDDHQAGVG